MFCVRILSSIGLIGYCQLSLFFLFPWSSSSRTRRHPDCSLFSTVALIIYFQEKN